MDSIRFDKMADYIINEINKIDATEISDYNKEILIRLAKKVEAEKKKQTKQSIINATKYAKKVFKTTKNNKLKKAKMINNILYVTDGYRLVGFYKQLDLPIAKEDEDWYSDEHTLHKLYEIAAENALNAIKNNIPQVKLPSVDIFNYAIDKAKENGIKNIGYAIGDGLIYNAAYIKDALEGINDVRIYKVSYDENKSYMDALYFIGNEGFTILPPLIKRSEQNETGFIEDERLFGIIK